MSTAHLVYCKNHKTASDFLSTYQALSKFWTKWEVPAIVGGWPPLPVGPSLCPTGWPRLPRSAPLRAATPQPCQRLTAARVRAMTGFSFNKAVFKPFMYKFSDHLSGKSAQLPSVAQRHSAVPSSSKLLVYTVVRITS